MRPERMAVAAQILPRLNVEVVSTTFRVKVHCSMTDLKSKQCALHELAFA